MSECCSCHINPPCSYCTSRCYCGVCNELVLNDDITEIDDCPICEFCFEKRIKVRSFSFECRHEEDKTIVANLRDLGLFVECHDTGSNVQFVLSDKELDQSQLDEVYDYPPGGFDWSDCIWGDVQCKYLKKN